MSVKHQKGVGKPRKISIAELHTRVRAVPFHFRKNVRTLSFKIGIPRSTVHRALKLGLLESTKNSIKPILTPKNKVDRVAFCHSFVWEQTFVDMLDHVDIDEKWFYLSQKVTSFILVPGEVPPLRLCKHKNHIEKAMCLSAMARPRQDPVTGVWWNGKIGTWFFVEQVPAKRTSENRAAGTLETKSVSVGRKETEDMIIGSWPAWEQRRIRIQLDNAPPHPKPGKLGKRIADRLTEYSAVGWDIDFAMQPANSPDLNILDLASFEWSSPSNIRSQLKT
jgi:hypothetical protein